MNSEEITSRLKALADSKSAEDRKTWTVLYWKAQGLKHHQIAELLRKNEITGETYGVNWVQRYSTRTYSLFGMTNASDDEKEAFMEDVLEAIRELTRTDPYLFFPERMTWPPEPPEPSKGPVNPYVEGKLLPPKRNWVPPMIGGGLLTLLCVAVVLGVAAWWWWTHRPTPAAPAPTNIPATSVQTLIPTNTPVPADTPAAPTATLAPTNPPPPTEAFVPPADGILFQDNFDTGIDTALHPASGKWITANGRLTNVFEEYGYDFIDLGSPQWVNYRVEADVDRSRGQIIFFVRNGTASYRFSFQGQNCWTNNTPDRFDCIAGEAKYAPPTFNLQIEVSGNDYIASIDGFEAQRISLSEAASGGIKIGIYCQRGFPCPSIDNLKVTYLP